MSRISLTLFVFLLCVPIVSYAQYGIVENFEGTTRHGWNENCYELGSDSYSGGGDTITTNMEVDGIGGGGSRGFRLGGTKAGGWCGFASQPGGVDITQIVNGMQTVGYTISIKDNQNDGDQFSLHVETGDFANGELFALTLGGTLQTHQFIMSTGTPFGTFNPANVTNLVLVVDSVNNGNFEVEIDDIGFIGTLAPTNPLVDNFDGHPTGAFSGPSTFTNTFGGVMEAISWGSGYWSGIDDPGSGDKALHFTTDGLMAGAYIDLGPHVGSQTDVSAYNTLQFDMSVTEAADTITVMLETIDAADWGHRSSYTVDPGLSMSTIQVPFSSLVSGPQGFNPDKVHRITFVPGNDNGNGVDVMVDNVQFVNAASVEHDALY